MGKRKVKPVGDSRPVGPLQNRLNEALERAKNRKSEIPASEYHVALALSSLRDASHVASEESAKLLDTGREAAAIRRVAAKTLIDMAISNLEMAMQELDEDQPSRVEGLTIADILKWYGPSPSA